ncbi:8047_t:CDS:2 [Gigaspora margarita]|uniref:8047_t:CDS:1 n=1 Tax=Gigaspora margarita TaxID=4874 RepID=A0ABN7UDA3_GIGMA|nr:8047_t:CDS:2 [Gigaspora margarita]
MVQLRNHFALVCNSTELLNKCVCDFRINIRGCEEENLFQEASLILVPYLFITSLTSAAFIFNQVFIKRKSIFYPSRERCFKWIKPKDAFNTVVCAYHLIEAACLLLLINDSYPNSIYAELGVCGLCNLWLFYYMLTTTWSLICGAMLTECDEGMLMNLEYKNYKLPEKSNQISVEQTYVVELNQITTQKTIENAHSSKSHRIDKRRDSIAEAFKRFISSSNNGLVSVGGTTLVSGQFGPTNQTEIHGFADSVNWQDNYSHDRSDDLSSNIMRAWLVKKPVRCDLANKHVKSDSCEICNNNL